MPQDSPPTWPPKPTPAAQAVVGLFRSRNIIWDNDHRIVADYGLTWTQFLTLLALRSAGEDMVLSPTQLYAETQASSGGMTKMLHGLQRDGLVTRLPNPADKRSRLVQATPDGAELVTKVVHKLIETNTALFRGILDDGEAETLAELLHKLLRGLQDLDLPKP